MREKDIRQTILALLTQPAWIQPIRGRTPSTNTSFHAQYMMLLKIPLPLGAKRPRQNDTLFASPRREQTP